MSDPTWDHERFEAMKREHRELAELLAEAREAVSLADRNRNQVGTLVTQLRDTVEVHFRHEEEGGYLKEVLESAPRLAARVEILHAQHEALLEEIEKLCILVRSGVETSSLWARIESDLHKFASRLINHEHAENSIVQEAFTVEVGSGD